MKDRATERRVFRYAPEFDMEHARYDALGAFYVEYKRVAGNATGERELKHVRHAARPDVTVHHGNWQGYSPVLHLADGTVVLQPVAEREPDHRGRYAFGGHDFTIVSTTNDGLFAHAVKFMRYREASGQSRPKLNQAAFNRTVDDKAYSRTLLVDHVTDTVTTLGRFDQTPAFPVTVDGCDLRETQQLVPDELRRHHPVTYCTAPGDGFKAFHPTMVTAPFAGDFKPKGYDDIVDACVMWWTHQDQRPGTIPFDRRIDVGMNVSKVCPVDIVMRGFNELSPFQRMIVATQNATKPMPRIAQYYARLDFDSKAFFNAIGV